MAGRAVVVGIALVAALAGGVAWLALRETPPEGGGSQGPAAEPSGSPASAPAPARTRAQAPPAWKQRGLGRVVGILRNPQGEVPLDGVPLELNAGDDGPGRVLTATTSADGSFTFEKVPDFPAWTFRAKVAEPRVDVEQAGVAVLPEKTTDLGVVYAAAPVALAGIVVDSAGAPVPGADVRLLRPFQLFGHRDLGELVASVLDEPAPVARAESGPDGRFRVERAPAGGFDLVASKDPFARGIVRVSLVAGASAPDVRIVLDAGHALDGRVVRKGEGRLDGIAVHATPMTGAFGLPWEVLPRMVRARTGASGEFRLTGLAAGKWKLQAAPDGEMSSEEVVVTVPAAAPAEIPIGGDASLAGVVLDPDGRPVDGASLTVHHEGGEGLARTRSGADGRYEVRGLKGGTTVNTVVHARGFPPFGDVLNIIQGEGKGRVELVAGVNALDVHLERGATLRCRIVERGTQNGLAAVRVRVRSSGLEGMFATAEGWTDAEGRVEIQGLAAGEQTISMEKAGWHSFGESAHSAMAGLVAKFMADDSEDAEPKQDPGKGFELVATAGAVVERELEMERAVVVAGRVAGADGSPLAGAKVRIEEEKSAGAMEFDIEALLTGMTGGGKDEANSRITPASGTFELTAPPGKPVRVVATAAGLAEGKSDVVKGIAGARVEGVEIRLDPGATIEGVVKDPDGAPVADVEIRWSAAEKQSPFTIILANRGGGGPPHTTTGADGRYRVSGVPPGKVELTARRAGFLQAKHANIAAERGATATVDVTLDRGAAISGTVVDASGRGVAGAMVTCTREGAGPMAMFEGAGAEPVAADAEGRFRVEGLASGKHQVSASANGLVQEASVEAVAGAADAVIVRLVPELSLSVLVTCGGRPVAGAYVDVTHEDPAGEKEEEEDEDASVDFDVAEAMAQQGDSGTTGADGRFVAKTLRPGTYTVSVQSDEEAPAPPNILETEVRGVAAGAGEVVVACPPGLEIRGTVIGADGRPAAEGDVSATTQPDEEDEDDVWREARIASGAFSVTALPPGKYDVTITVPGCAKQVLVAEAGKPLGEVRLEAGGIVKGRIVVPGASRFEVAMVELEYDGSDDDSEHGVARKDGRFTISGVRSGAWTVRAEAVVKGRRWTAEMKVTVRAGATVDLGDIRLADAGPAEPEDGEEDDEE